MRTRIIGTVVVVAALCLSAGAFLATHHLVRAPQGWLVISKRYITAADTFADIRGWTPANFKDRPEFRRALVENGYADLAPEPPEPTPQQSAFELRQATREQLYALEIQLRRRLNAWLAELGSDWGCGS